MAQKARRAIKAIKGIKATPAKRVIRETPAKTELTVYPEHKAIKVIRATLETTISLRLRINKISLTS